MFRALLAVVLGLAAPTLFAADLQAFQVAPAPGGGTSYSLSIQTLLLLTALTLLPAILMTMTSFTRIIIVLGLLRQALGTSTTPSNPILVGLSLFLTLFVMSPVLEKIYTDAAQPYLDGAVDVRTAARIGAEPLRKFMLAQTRDTDLLTFARLSGQRDGFATPADVPFTVLMPAFMTSELTTAFQIGFLLFIPFLVIDLVVSSVLMSMGMMMLSPMLVSLPFKLMLFVLVDGWSLVLGSLAGSFRGFAV